uniref:Uncharacterized protein n=1 Tax=Haptolina ericina TaxID=156174 RepID=A0A7S3F9H8_9EUKA|mmetsp:Transcript_59760/g.133141  ORF Transcript_59760/g.133141 Transcript_59760/m.133141 type:complete len:252 (+) Transcript_59760:71-826(+)
MTSVGSSVGEAALTFCFEVLTDIAFVPPLVVMHRFRRHFELYIGVFQLATGFLYNFCNALNMNVFLSELQWHALNNILTTTYFLLLLIHLQANTNPTVDIVLRYAAFTAVWIAQIKDEYWNPWYTALVVAVFCMMPVCKFCGAMRLPPYEPEKLLKGAVAGVASAVCFVVGLDDQVDPFRLFHGLSQALVGLALYYLWQLVPLHESEKKIEDPVDPKLVRDALVVPGMGARAMSGQDLPLCTVQLAKLEYY